LKINPPKTNVIVFGTQSFHNNINLTGLFTHDDVCLRLTDSIKHLGVHLDNLLNLQLHVNNLVSSCYFVLRHISSIRKFITQDNCIQLVISYVTSKLDYCNSLFIGMPKCLISKLQKVQNAAVRVIFIKKKFQSVSEELINLHWLKIESRIVFKAVLLIFKCLAGTAPNFLINSLAMRSDDPLSAYYRKLHEHIHNSPISVLGHKAFPFYAPRLWNALPRYLSYILEINLFKTSLKTYLFTDFHDYKIRVNRLVKIL